MSADRRRWVDYLGVLLSIAGLVLLVYGIISGGDASSWAQRGVIIPVIGGLAVLAVFCGHESRTEFPALNVRLFLDPRLSSAATAISLNFFAMAGVYFFMSFYLQNVRGYSPLHAGLLTTPVTGALIGYHSLSQNTPIVALELIFLLQGAGMGIVMPAATESVMSVVPRERGGAGSAIINTSRQVAVALGVAVLGSILAQAYRIQLAPALASLPAAARSRAKTQSIAATQAVAGHLSHGRQALITTADQAFVHAMRLTTVITIAVCGAVLSPSGCLAAEEY